MQSYLLLPMIYEPKITRYKEKSLAHINHGGKFWTTYLRIRALPQEYEKHQ